MTRPPEKIMQVIISIEYSGEWYIEYSILWNTSGPFWEKGYGPKTFTINRVEKYQNNEWIVDVDAWKLDDSYDLLRIKMLRTDNTVLDERETRDPYGKVGVYLFLEGTQ